MFEEKLAAYSLLQHPFYVAWQKGELTLPTLQCYAKQYRHHVNAFPCYLSALHSQSTSLETRRVILENLMDEEGIDGTAHPILWDNFAKGLGVKEDALHADAFPSTQNLLDRFEGLTKQSFAAGLGALYAYERQIPTIAETKIDGLKRFYNINDPSSLEFFEVHQKADEWHSQEVADLIKALPEDQQKEAEQGAVVAAQALWDFLSGIDVH